MFFFSESAMLLGVQTEVNFHVIREILQHRIPKQKVFTFLLLGTRFLQTGCKRFPLPYPVFAESLYQSMLDMLHITFCVVHRYLGQRYLGQTDMRGGGDLVKSIDIFMFGVHKGRTFQGIFHHEIMESP